MNLEIRRVPLEKGNEDLQKMVKLEAALNREIKTANCWLQEEAEVMDWLLRERDYGKPRLVLLAEESKSPKGHVIYSAIDNPCFVSSLYVVKDYRGNGIGSELLNCVIKDAKSRALSDIYLVPMNKSAKNFYRHKGFQSRKNESVNGLFLPVQ